MKKASLLSKISKSKAKANLGILQRDGTYCATPEEIIDLLLDTHFPGSEAGHRNDVLNVDNTSTKEDTEIIDGEEDEPGSLDLSALQAAISLAPPRRGG